MMVSIAYAVGGAHVYMLLERPEEKLKYEEKKQVARDIKKSMTYLGQVKDGNLRKRRSQLFS